MRYLALLFACTLLPLLTGCASLAGDFETRLACTPDGSEIHVISKWGPFSIGTKLAKGDTALCAKPVPQAAPLAPMRFLMRA